MAAPTDADVGWHIVLRLGWVELAVAAVVLVVLMVVSFEAGRRSVAPPAGQTDDLAEVLAPGPAEPGVKAPPTPAPGRGGSDVVTPLQPEPLPPVSFPTASQRPSETPAMPPKAASPFAEGSYYVVVQYFSGSRKRDAEEARDFLRRKGIECVVHQGPARDWWLVATEAFSSAQQSQRLVARIRELGKEYFPIGRYDFRDPVARKF